jgi:hypothetical protein
MPMNRPFEWESPQLRDFRVDFSRNPELVREAEQNLGVNTDAPDWPQPEPLGSGLPPVKAFEPSLLPEALRAWVADIGERMQVPFDAPAACAVVALAGCVSRQGRGRDSGCPLPPARIPTSGIPA